MSLLLVVMVKPAMRISVLRLAVLLMWNISLVVEILQAGEVGAPCTGSAVAQI